MPTASPDAVRILRALQLATLHQTDEVIDAAQRERLDRQRRRLAAAGARKDAGIDDKEIAPAVAATVIVDDRPPWIMAHPARSEHMRGMERVVSSILLEDLRRSRCFQDLTRFLRHEIEPPNLELGK